MTGLRTLIVTGAVGTTQGRERTSRTGPEAGTSTWRTCEGNGWAGVPSRSLPPAAITSYWSAHLVRARPCSPNASPAFFRT